jgi:hypothetical protein
MSRKLLAKLKVLIGKLKIKKRKVDEAEKKE